MLHAPSYYKRTFAENDQAENGQYSVVISSIWGQTGAACEVAYSTVKGAQILLLKH